MSSLKRQIIAQSDHDSNLSGVPSRRTTFYCNREYALKHSIAGTESGRMYVELHRPLHNIDPVNQKNIVFVHGDYFTGQVILLFINCFF
jgi:hypothetical protein